MTAASGLGAPRPAVVKVGLAVNEPAGVLLRKSVANPRLTTAPSPAKTPAQSCSGWGIDP